MFLAKYKFEQYHDETYNIRIEELFYYRILGFHRIA